MRYVLCRVALDALCALSGGTRCVMCFVGWHSSRYVLCRVALDALCALSGGTRCVMCFVRCNSSRFMLCRVALDALCALSGGTRVVIYFVRLTRVATVAMHTIVHSDRDFSVILLFQRRQPVYLIKLVCASLTLVCLSIII